MRGGTFHLVATTFQPNHPMIHTNLVFYLKPFMACVPGHVCESVCKSVCLGCVGGELGRKRV